MPLPVWLAASIPAAIGSAINVAGGLFGANMQQNKNLELAKWQAQYNSPANQMARYRAAGLNPNLIYGQGTPGNMERVMPADYASAFSNLGSNFQQQQYIAAQTELASSKTQESQVKQGLMKAQESLIKANPLLDPEYVRSMVTNLKSTAQLKEQEAKFMTQSDMYSGYSTKGEQKMHFEIESLAQKLGLGEQDSKIKAQIIQSKEFQNALHEIQVKWLRDKEITPQHIYMGIMLLLQKMM